MGNVVRKIGTAEGQGLRAALEAAGFELRDAPHARFAAKGPGVSVTLYNSGKLLVQGKGAEDFAATYLTAAPGEGPAPADCRNVVDEPIIGTDESGKGDYFGPLVVAAVLVRPEDVEVLRTLGVRDSKSMGDAEARRVAGEITSGYGDRVAVVSIPPVRYNELRGQFGNNLNRLLAWAHARAIEDVLEHHDCDRALSDKFGNERLIKNALMERGQQLRLDQRVRAEAHPAVAAASIVARARFLRDLEQLGRDAGEKLPKGAGSPVDAAARRIYASGGLEALRGIAKLHFRTTEKAQR
jgi:ribonuclease HIII